MAQRFAREGALVVCAARSGDLVGETAALLERAGGRAIAVTADAASEAGAQSIVNGALEGDRIDRAIKSQAELRGIDAARMRASFVERSPLRRMSTADDIASLAIFLCSDLARNISGQCLPVTAGEPA